MIGRVHARMNSVYCSRSCRYYARQSAGKGIYMIEEKVLRGKGRGMLFVGSYNLFMKYGEDYLRFLLSRWTGDPTRSRKAKNTMGSIHLYGGEIRSINYGQ